MRSQRDAILAAAADLLAEGGYAACTVNAVAQRANVAAGTVYNHFANKADLAAYVFRAIAARELDAVAAAARGGSAVQRIAAVIETFALRALKQPRRAYALLAEPADPAVDALRLEFRSAFRDVIAEAIRDGVASGELPPQDPGVVAAALVGAIGEALVGPLAGADDSVDAVPALLSFACRAIGGAPRDHP
jgi:AcrR family transcriptional regulator